MADVPITFGPWEPDKAPHMSPALVEAVNVLPVAGAYAPFNAHAPIAGTEVSPPVRGFFATPLADGSPIIYGATESKIFRILNGSLVEAYSNPGMEAGSWGFAAFGGRVIAVNPSAPPLGALPGAMFTALGGTPSPAHVVGVIENFLVLGNMVDEDVDGAVPNRVRWSGFNNPDTWGTSVGTQADYEDLNNEGGPVIAITGRETGTIFQRKAITRMQYTGGATVFSFTTVEEGRGALSTGSVVDIGALVFFIADDGFFAWDGTQSIPIGTGKVDRWFNERVDHNRLDRIVSGFDPVSRCVLWAFPEAGQSSPSTMIAYSISDQRWTQIDVAVQQLGAAATLATRLEDMPTPDLFDGTFDDPAYAGGRPYLAAIDADGAFGTFSGPAMASTIVTGDWQSSPGQRSFIQGIRPLIDSASVAVAVGEREQSSADAVAWGSASVRGVDGMCPQRADARHARYRQTTTANDNWTRSIGLEVAMIKAGRR